MIAAIVLAAGRASRMGAANKLLAVLDGEPLVRHAVRAARAVAPTTVVTGHDADAVRAALADLDVAVVHNPAFATGMASSIRAGIAACAASDGALVCLGDMPRVTAVHLAQIAAAFAGASSIVVPTCHGRRGNPVLWGRDHFAALAALEGDVGARALLDRLPVQWLALDDPAILLDVDTPEALVNLRDLR